MSRAPARYVGKLLFGFSESCQSLYLTETHKTGRYCKELALGAFYSYLIYCYLALNKFTYGHFRALKGVF